MTKPIMVDGKPHRMRRGKLVLIPEEWVGKITTDRTKRQRPSHLIHKLRKGAKHGRFNKRAAEDRAAAKSHEL